jgi:hypothetical protein
MIVLIVVFTLAGWLGTAAHAASPSGAAPTPPAPPGRVDLLAQRLAKDPIQVTDHAVRELGPDTAARLRALTGRLGVPVYFVVEPRRMPGDVRAEELIPLLHDRLAKDGLYVVTDPTGSGGAQQFGGSLPADRAWTTAYLEMPYEAKFLDYVQRFVEILTAPNVAQRIKERRPRPEDTTPSRGEVRDRKEMTALGIGSAVSGVPLLAGLVVMRLRKKARR